MRNVKCGVTCMRNVKCGVTCMRNVKCVKYCGSYLSNFVWNWLKYSSEFCVLGCDDGRFKGTCRQDREGDDQWRCRRINWVIGTYLPKCTLSLPVRHEFFTVHCREKLGGFIICLELLICIFATPVHTLILVEICVLRVVSMYNQPLFCARLIYAFFCFNAPFQVTPLIIYTYFRFNALWLAAFYYANPKFLWKYFLFTPIFWGMLLGR
jgi:hypothetical protein